MKRNRNTIRVGLGERIFDVVNNLILLLIALSMLYPFVYVLAISLNDPNDSQLGGIWLYPRVLSLESYKIIFSDPSLLQALWISVSRTVLGTVLTVFGCSMFAYVFTRNEFVLYKPLKGFFFFAMFFGGGGLIPTYLLYLNLGLYDNFLVYIIPTIINLWYVTLFRTYFRSIPGELLEAARIDGAGEFAIYWRVLLPVSKPIIATITLFSAVAQWNSYRDTLYYTVDKNLRSLQYIVMEIIKKAEGSQMIDRAEMFEIFHGDASMADPVSLRMAITICTVVPIVMVYPFLQKHFMKGMMIGSMKG
ncbi:MAG TPA: carbohydrate ABC transporter permease [Candidatus Faecousia excrementigallinarum]|uniref:Carbohydrate ABC transporter permease n=1 Tax=Candidatus Faecousia excrementigallinarum TaxID=2840806 RepID=A0A9D0Z2U9_9FIRM|nr:carbohydrate ABC transporter permease [Candidatus Faecousia excrementigallinarum]